MIDNFFSSTTGKMCSFAVCQYSHRSQKVVDEEMLSPNLISCVYLIDDDLKFSFWCIEAFTYFVCSLVYIRRSLLERNK